MSFYISSPFLYIAATTTILVIVAVALVYKYPDCGIFDPPRKSIPYPKGLPVLGNLLDIIANMDRVYEYMTDIYEDLDTMTL